MIMSKARWRQFTLILGVAVGVSGCSTIADLDPTGLLSDKSDQTSQFPPDQAAAPTATPDQTAGTTPDLASIPAKPTNTSPASQQQTAQALASDGAQARYSADALRGGTDAAAPPPAASDAAPSAAQRVLGTGPTAIASADAPPTADAGPAAQPQMAASLPPPTAQAAPAAAAPSLPDGAQPAPPPNAPMSNAPVNMAAVPPSANVQTASVAPAMSASPVGPSARPAGAEPAVPANTPMRGSMMAQPALSDAALGFRPSAAPPLAPSVNDFVAAPIVAQYRQTASNAGMASVTAAPAVPAVPLRGEMASADSSPAVVTNMAAVSGAPAAIAAMNGGVAPTAVIYFPGDGTNLSTAARAEVRTAVASFRANGGQGTVRVVGHASSRTANMPVEKHLETIFDKSQARANAVAQELIHDGIPASRVLIDAVGDSQPIYYESMPEGEDGNRRAEIFVQS
ncbi:MAG TPA: OmpA family protein [Rhizomicrobium sp.]|nr:OmpA family protein [Rhizomicrobium sp.]